MIFFYWFKHDEKYKKEIFISDFLKNLFEIFVDFFWKKNFAFFVENIENYHFWEKTFKKKRICFGIFKHFFPRNLKKNHHPFIYFFSFIIHLVLKKSSLRAHSKGEVLTKIVRIWTLKIRPKELMWKKTETLLFLELFLFWNLRFQKSFIEGFFNAH